MPASAATRLSRQSVSTDLHFPREHPAPAARAGAGIAQRLLAHYDLHRRDLPWRAASGEVPDPYRVWLSEIMLQQTTVASVMPRFARFLDRWPTVEALAAAPDADVLGEWAGLGYYARARNLHACARQIVALGSFPDTEVELRQLPGIGAYTAAAIAAIAFGEQATVVDTNVERVVSRLHAIERPVAEARAEICALAGEMTPAARPGDFAQAMMDLGATICRPRKPACLICPLSGLCRAFASREPERFPAPKVKPHRPHRHGVAWWIERESAVWLVRRPARGLLGGMAALPGPEWGEGPPRDATMTKVHHGFTHFTLDLHLVARPAPPDPDGWWQPLSDLASAGLPTLYRRAVEAGLACREKVAG